METRALAPSHCRLDIVGCGQESSSIWGTGGGLKVEKPQCPVPHVPRESVTEPGRVNLLGMEEVCL